MRRPTGTGCRCDDLTSPWPLEGRTTTLRSSCQYDRVSIASRRASVWRRPCQRRSQVEILCDLSHDHFASRPERCRHLDVRRCAPPASSPTTTTSTTTTTLLLPRRRRRLLLLLPSLLLSLLALHITMNMTMTASGTTTITTSTTATTTNHITSFRTRAVFWLASKPDFSQVCVPRLPLSFPCWSSSSRRSTTVAFPNARDRA